MPPEPVPSIAQVALSLLILYGGICLIVGAIIAGFTVRFWAAEKLADTRVKPHDPILEDQETARLEDLFGFPLFEDTPDVIRQLANLGREATS